jgi:hypothetical protein
LQNDYTIRYNNRCLQLEKCQSAVIRPKHKITVHEHLDGRLSLKVRGFNLNFREIKRENIQEIRRRALALMLQKLQSLDGCETFLSCEMNDPEINFVKLG